MVNLNNRPSVLMAKLDILKVRFNNFRSNGHINRGPLFDDEIINPTPPPLPTDTSQSTSDATCEQNESTDAECFAEVTEITEQAISVTSAPAEIMTKLIRDKETERNADVDTSLEPANCVGLLRQIAPELITQSQLAFSQIEMAMWTHASETSDISDDETKDVHNEAFISLDSQQEQSPSLVDSQTSGPLDTAQDELLAPQESTVHPTPESPSTNDPERKNANYWRTRCTEAERQLMLSKTRVNLLKNEMKKELMSEMKETLEQELMTKILTKLRGKLDMRGDGTLAPSSSRASTKQGTAPLQSEIPVPLKTRFESRQFVLNIQLYLVQAI